ncbi:MAG: WGR domain-containing protein [Rhodobacteraceae bacterium]|nr:MAG: WGR domain-containing protein [Paracoccaceae bacterium]
MIPVHLQKVVPDQNMARFYHMDIAPTLFGEVSVLRTWGRMGTHGKTTVETCATSGAAVAAADRTLRQKLRRGYLSF